MSPFLCIIYRTNRLYLNRYWGGSLCMRDLEKDIDHTDRPTLWPFLKQIIDYISISPLTMVKCSFLTLSIWMRYWGENLTACVWPGDRQSPWHYTMGILTNCKQILIISAFALWKMMLIVKHRRGSQGQSSKWLHVGSLLKEFWVYPLGVAWDNNVEVKVSCKVPISMPFQRNELYKMYDFFN